MNRQIICFCAFLNRKIMCKKSVEFHFCFSSSNVSPKCQPQRRQGNIVFFLLFNTVRCQMSLQIACLRRGSHIGCTCLTFPHYVFSNVFSNCLHEKRHSHIGCIYLTFVHCAFSKVSSKLLHNRMHIHIFCICLAFVHCAFSNVSSNDLLLSTVSFQMLP